MGGGRGERQAQSCTENDIFLPTFHLIVCPRERSLSTFATEADKKELLPPLLPLLLPGSVAQLCYRRVHLHRPRKRGPSTDTDGVAYAHIIARYSHCARTHTDTPHPPHKPSRQTAVIVVFFSNARAMLSAPESPMQSPVLFPCPAYPHNAHNISVPCHQDGSL